MFWSIRLIELIGNQKDILLKNRRLNIGQYNRNSNYNTNIAIILSVNNIYIYI